MGRLGDQWGITAHHERANAQGARIVMEIEDMFGSHRRYEALDLEGHRWHFAQPFGDAART